MASGPRTTGQSHRVILTLLHSRGMRCVAHRRLFLPLTAFTFAAMSNAVNLTDGLDGLAAGTCAAALTAMAVAVLPMYPGEAPFPRVSVSHHGLELVCRFVTVHASLQRAVLAWVLWRCCLWPQCLFALMYCTVLCPHRRFVPLCFLFLGSAL